ncbi:MAG: sulfite exporter TauE/SafE family protein [Acidobacteriia bacterium]|nr:sulfite exporter TauE/SafE family protein [Terriglobia bacterium]
MPALLGFLIAVAVGLTGTGAGSVAAPALMVFLGVPPAQAVGTALLFGAAIKLAAVPAYIVRRQVNFRVAALMLAGGLPGAVVGSLLLRAFDARAALGLVIVAAAALNVYRALRAPALRPRPRLGWLPWIALPIGAEVGFSSAGAGALGSLALMGFTHLAPAEVVGTDLCFGLGLSLASGGIHFSMGNYDAHLLAQLIGGGIAGVITGVLLSGRIPARILRVALSLWLAVLGLELCWAG